MDSHRFLELLTTSWQPEELDYRQVKDLSLNFPYFHLAHGIAARYEFEINGGKHGDSLPIAALTSPDRLALKKWIEFPRLVQKTEATGESDSFQNPENPLNSVSAESNTTFEESQSLPVTQNESIEESDKPERKRRNLPKDDLIESIKKREKQEILDSKKKEQIDLIGELSKKDFKLAAIKEIESDQPTENLADASTRLNDNLISETFARILIKQSKKETAIQIYEKLALKFPDKRTYFADLIEKLKE